MTNEIEFKAKQDEFTYTLDGIVISRSFEWLGLYNGSLDSLIGAIKYGEATGSDDSGDPLCDATFFGVESVEAAYQKWVTLKEFEAQEIYNRIPSPLFRNRN